ncbi:MAG TPA: DMT family transporter [Microvirga sp.]|jgi:drug/metabolite transporter (DMT)-like permease|nr:DMT family transporter [Microvirga sp.]
MTRRSILLVVMWMSGALVSFSATAVAVRALARTFTVFEMLALRNTAGLAILVAFALARPELRAALRPRRMGLHAVRNLVHFGGTYAWTLGVTLLPLATVFALEFTTPVWVAGLAVLLLGERLTMPRLVAIALGFAGVIVILRPGLEALQPAALVVLGSALGFALTAIGTKTLTRTVSTFAILFWMNAMQLPLNLAGSDPAFWTRIAPAQALPLAGISICGLLSHFCLTNAYRHGDATMVVPLDFLRIPLIAVVGWQLYGEILDPFVFLGSVLIIAGILWNLRAEARGPAAKPAS